MNTRRVQQCRCKTNHRSSIFAYTLDVCDLLTQQLTRFRALNTHQRAGHVANIDFWAQEVRHCLSLIDGYEVRFRRMKAAQLAHMREHKVTEYWLSEPTITAAPDLRKLDAAERTASRRELVEAWRNLLIICCRTGLLPHERADGLCAGTGTSLSPGETGLR